MPDYTTSKSFLIFNGSTVIKTMCELRTFCTAAHSQSTMDTAMRCRADLELRWKSNSWPKDSAGRISWDGALSWGSQIHLHKAPSNLEHRDANRAVSELWTYLAFVKMFFVNFGFFPAQQSNLTWQPWGEHEPRRSPLLLDRLSPSLHLQCTPGLSPSPDWSLDVPLCQPYPVASIKHLSSQYIVQYIHFMWHH